MDRFLLTVSRLPWQVWTLLAVTTLGATYPRHTARQTLLGVSLDSRLSVWVSQLAIVAVLTVILVGSWFMVRAVLRYVEQDRWPRKAGSVEMDELSRAETQLSKDADILTRATDEGRILGKELKRARETIAYLLGELERGRPLSQDEDDESERRAKS
jgi:hypothetical protein